MSLLFFFKPCSTSELFSGAGLVQHAWSFGHKKKPKIKAQLLNDLAAIGAEYFTLKKKEESLLVTINTPNVITKSTNNENTTKTAEPFNSEALTELRLIQQRLEVLQSEEQAIVAIMMQMFLD